MNKEKLIELIKKNDYTYPQFLERAQKNTASTQWGMGGTPPYSLEPYRFELLGSKPGRMLKKSSEPARNRYCYSYDNQGRIIHCVEYAGLGGQGANKAWMTSDDFYEHFDHHSIRFVFGSVFRDGLDASLTRVVWVDTKNNQATKAYQLEKRDDEYTEEEYFYEDDKITKIRLTWFNLPYPDRNFNVYHEPSGLRITDLSEEGECQIYPKNNRLAPQA